jgi:hypothetical protein
MSRSPHATALRPPTLVVLLMPELLAHHHDVGKLRESLVRTDRSVRVLFRVATQDQLPSALEFGQGAIETQLLLGRGITPPAGLSAFACWPAGGTANELDEFAFAMADVVVVDPSKATAKRARRAKELGKPLIEPGDPLPFMSAVDSVTQGLDPDAERPRWRGRRFFGRPEQTMLELLAFDFSYSHPGGRAGSWERLRSCLGRNWHPRAYFVSADCRDVAPDLAVIDPASSLVRHFEGLDRSALYGSYMHRDQIWAVHALGAFAVFAAVAGVIFNAINVFVWVEVAMLGAMALLVWAVQKCNLHDKWMACRMGAEQLRIARMCLPLMVLPRALISTDAVFGSPSESSDKNDLTFRALAEVKRVIRDEGPLLQGVARLPDSAVTWLRCIVADQLDYHRTNHAKLERAEHRGHCLNRLIFLLVIVIAGYEIVSLQLNRGVHPLWPLLVTAGGPALLAALHGAMTRLGIVHRAALSWLAQRDLKPILDDLTEIEGRPVKTDEVWEDVRALTFRAAEAMGRENTSWHGQVRLQRDALAS